MSEDAPLSYNQYHLCGGQMMVEIGHNATGACCLSWFGVNKSQITNNTWMLGRISAAQ
jgi:hypothetical protein